MASGKRSVFISYSHEDGQDLAERLVSTLEIYMDVYWDAHLEAGAYPPQLFHEIKVREFFLLVMTPRSLASTWCQDELNYAEEHTRKIALAKKYPEVSENEKKLTANYTYGDFTTNFEKGFRRLTRMMLGRETFSWEYLAYSTDDKDLFIQLQAGRIPGLIAKDIAEWVIVNPLWGAIEQYIQECNAGMLFSSTPSSVVGVAGMCGSLIEQFAQARDFIGIQMSREVLRISDTFIQQVRPCPDDNHENIGATTHCIIESVRSFLSDQLVAKRDFKRLVEVQSFFDFSVADRLRKFMIDASNNSRL